MAEKKLTDKVIDITTAGVSLGAGGMVTGSLGDLGNVHVQQVAGTAQRGLGVASAALPVAGAGALLDELAGLGKKRK